MSAGRSFIYLVIIIQVILLITVSALKKRVTANTNAIKFATCFYYESPEERQMCVRTKVILNGN